MPESARRSSWDRGRGAIDVDGRTVTLVIGSPFEDVERFWALSAPLLQTIAFAAP